MSVTIVLPQHGQANLTLAAIRSIRNHEPTPWPILVVDDGSPDDSADRIARLHDPRVPLLRQPHRGVTAAWNHAARRAETQVLVFLNNDIEPRGPFVEQLVAPLAPHPSELHPGRLPLPVLTGPRLRREAALPTHILERLPTQRFLEGWCFALRRDLYLALGGFDESLKLYWSDTDLQCRALRLDPRRGESALHAVHGLPLRHLGHRTAHAQPDRRTTWLRDRETFMKKWAAGSG